MTVLRITFPAGLKAKAARLLICTCFLKEGKTLNIICTRYQHFKNQRILKYSLNIILNSFRWIFIAFFQASFYVDDMYRTIEEKKRWLSGIRVSATSIISIWGKKTARQPADRPNFRLRTAFDIYCLQKKLLSKKPRPSLYCCILTAAHSRYLLIRCR